MNILFKRLRRIIAMCMVISLALSGTALAATTTVTPSVTSVEVSSGKAFTFSIAVKTDYDFVGVELGLKVSDETVLKCTGFTASSALGSIYKVSPMLSEGVYYLGFFATDSSVYNGDKEALNLGTLTFTYEGSETATITLDSATIITGYDAEAEIETSVKYDGSFTVTVTPGEGGEDPITPVNPGNTGGGSVVTPTIVVTEAEVPLAGSLMSVETELENGVIYYYGSNGEEVFVPFCLYIDGVMYFIGNPLIEYFIKENPKSFTDVGSHWAADCIAKITSREIYAGFPDGSFGPNQAMTRAQLAKVLAIMASADVSAYTNRVFDDVEPTAWYGPYVAWANAAGIVMGDGNGGFRPDSNVSRQEMAVMLSRFISYMGLSIPEVETGISFADNDQISDWAKAAASEMQSYGIITGRTGNLFAPVGISTRAEVATMLWRLIEATVTALAS